jgi:outer membrane biosynthesis protein TonB
MESIYCPARPRAAKLPVMARANHELDSLRFSRRESERVIAALLLSLLVHLGVWGGYEAGRKTGLWEKLHPAAWLHPAAKNFPVHPPPPAQNSEPNIFVDVSHADADAPVSPKYYSNKNSRAANPDLAEANVPQLNGKQKDVPKTEDVPQLPKLQPSMPPPQPQLARSEPDEKPQPPGDLDPVKPKKYTPPPQATPPKPRPRTLNQALAQNDQLPGQQMQQAGGVARHALWSSLDAKATPFGDYDRAIIEAVSQRWYDLIANHNQDRSGKVMLRFKLKPDGTVIEMQTLENDVGELLGYLCQEAIEEAAPFAKWPSDMAHEIGKNYRDISFTFYYY